MSRNRSSAYWAANRYTDEAAEPAPTAPLDDLPAAAAARFKLLRAGLTELAGVAEAVRYMGASWRWAWEYGVGNRKLCWVHVIGDALSATFTMSDPRRTGSAGPAGSRPTSPAPSRKGSAPGRSSGAGCRSTTVARWRRFSAWPPARRNGWRSGPAPHRSPQLRARRKASGGAEDSE